MSSQCKRLIWLPCTLGTFHVVPWGCTRECLWWQPFSLTQACPSSRPVITGTGNPEVEKVTVLRENKKLCSISECGQCRSAVFMCKPYKTVNMEEVRLAWSPGTKTAMTRPPRERVGWGARLIWILQPTHQQCKWSVNGELFEEHPTRATIWWKLNVTPRKDCLPEPCNLRFRSKIDVVLSRYFGVIWYATIDNQNHKPNKNQ